jgi:hypothetical protein
MFVLTLNPKFTVSVRSICKMKLVTGEVSNNLEHKELVELVDLDNSASGHLSSVQMFLLN